MSVHDRLNQLADLGMAVPDRERAAHSLLHIGFHRLSSYWQPFQVQPEDGKDRAFRAGTEFSDVIAHYAFDGHLRSMLADALGNVEVSARALWAGHLAREGGDKAHLAPALFAGQYHQKKLDELRENYQRTAEPGGPDWSDATIWEVTEAMSFGQLSRWYNDISARRIRNAIARHYQLNHRMLSSILFNMAHLRNICAHHGRLWNRNLYTGLRIPNFLATYCNPEAEDGLYDRLVIIAYLMDVIDPRGYWKSGLVDLLVSYPAISKDRMGFPENWATMDFWQ